MFTNAKLAQLCYETARFMKGETPCVLDPWKQDWACRAVRAIIGGCNSPAILSQQVKLGPERTEVSAVGEDECRIYIAVVKAYLETTKMRGTGGAQ